MSRLAVFDLDNTLLSGDSEVLWVEYLLERALLDARQAGANAEMDRRYRAGTATPAEFSSFYASTLAGRSAAEWQPVLAAFIATCIRPRLPDAATALVRTHHERGDLLVLSTASSRFLSAPTARLLGFEHLIATELQVDAGGRFTGATQGTLNMRAGKVERLQQWLRARGNNAPAALASATFYSDSINDLPLLAAVGEPVVVDPDARLRAQARALGWPVLALERAPFSFLT
ncbi:MAG: HAD family hydrolase [Comamonas sp.]